MCITDPTNRDPFLFTFSTHIRVFVVQDPCVSIHLFNLYLTLGPMGWRSVILVILVILMPYPLVGFCVCDVQYLLCYSILDHLFSLRPSIVSHHSPHRCCFTSSTRTSRSISRFLWDSLSLIASPCHFCVLLYYYLWGIVGFYLLLIIVTVVSDCRV